MIRHLSRPSISIKKGTAMPDFTQEQQQAIYTRGQNLLVSAAAGSGKTAVLVERIVTLLAEGAKVDRMLVVTYTRAAAAEMRERVLKRLRELDSTPHIREQLQQLQGAQIKTLHSFCAWLLKRHFLEAELPPAFAVDASPAMDALRARALRETLDEALLDRETASALLRLERASNLEERIRRTANFLLCQPDPTEWTRTALAGYETMAEDFPSSPPGRALEKMKGEQLDTAASRIEEALQTACSPDGPALYIDALVSDLAAIEDARSGGTAFFVRLPGKKQECDEGKKERVKALRQDAKNIVQKTEKAACMDDRALSRMKEMAIPLRVLLDVSLAYIARFSSARLAAGALDYSDLEHRTLRALREASVRTSLREQFDHILVDEYQDANPIQEAILSAIARADNRFMVGDVKQSIYRFRMADPTVFLDKQTRYGQSDGGLRIDLNLNFRSAAPVLDAVNHVFSRAMSGPSSEVQYDERASLKLGRKTPGGLPVDVLLIEEPQPAEGYDDESTDEEVGEWMEELGSEEREAIEAARIAASFIGKPLEEGGNPVRAADIAILLRAPRARTAEFQRAFDAAGVPLTIDAGGALFETPEVAAFLDLLRAIDNRHRDIPLLSALRAFGGFSLEELACVRMERREGSYAQAAFACAESGGALGEKAKAFLGQLLAWRNQARTLPLIDFLQSLLESTRYERLQSLMPAGEYRARNLRAFLAMAALMPNASLGEFIDSVELRRAAGGDNAAVEPPEGLNAARLMTVHKSKGLEFPIVIGCGLGKRLRPRDTGDFVLLHRDLGIASRWADETVSFKSETPARAALAYALRMEALNEEIRILYVMMTRARDKLILTGCVGDADKAIARWASTGKGFANANTLLDAVGPALVRHADGAVLRERLDVPPPIESHPARYSIRISPYTQSAPSAEQADSLRAFLRAQEARAGQDVPTELAKRLAYRPADEGEALPQKTSVTAASRQRSVPPKPPALPIFLEGTQQSPAAQRGLAMHAVLRALDFDALRPLTREETLAELHAQIGRMQERLLLTHEQARGIRAESIVEFLWSGIGRVALSSGEVLREQPFNLRVDDGEAVRLMQGVIDLCFADSGGAWTLVDYKTDRYGLEPEAVRERHGAQLMTYARALETLTGRPVARRAVYLFHNGGVVDV